MNLQLSPAAWLSIDTPTRIKIAELFGIPQKKPTHVSGGQVVDSGHAWEDLEVITKESITEKLAGLGISMKGSEDFGKLWDALVFWASMIGGGETGEPERDLKNTEFIEPVGSAAVRVKIQKAAKKKR